MGSSSGHIRNQTPPKPPLPKEKQRRLGPILKAIYLEQERVEFLLQQIMRKLEEIRSAKRDHSQHSVDTSKVMTEEEAGSILREMYSDGLSRGEAVSMVYIFAIKYADDLNGMDVHNVRSYSGIPEGYAAEISKGRNLAKYVRLELGL